MRKIKRPKTQVPGEDAELAGALFRAGGWDGVRFPILDRPFTWLAKVHNRIVYSVFIALMRIDRNGNGMTYLSDDAIRDIPDDQKFMIVLARGPMACRELQSAVDAMANTWDDDSALSEEPADDD